MLQAIILWLKCLFAFKSDLYTYLKELPDLLIQGILSNLSPSVRDYFQEFIYFLAANIHIDSVPLNQTPLSLLLVKMLDLNMVLHEQNCGELSELLAILIDIYMTCERKNEMNINITDKLKELFSTIQQYNSKEVATNSPQDNVLVGLLQLTTKFVKAKECSLELDNLSRMQIIEEIFFSCLFPLRCKVGENKYKCKSNKSREAAFQLISVLMENIPECTNFFFRECVLPLRKKITELNEYSFNVERRGKSSSGFVGIKNLGCICYIISILQQFFMISPFRNALLSVDDKKPPVFNEAGIDDNLLHQLQNLFVNLNLSMRVDYIPSSLCHSIKEPNGKPINVCIQHDAHEFLNIIFDKLDRSLKPTCYSKILPNIFGGKCCSQVVCSKCGNVSATYEDYYTLSLEIKNQKNIYDALGKFIASNAVSDFLCEVCNKKLDVEKRTLLSTLPNVLIVHLQRFTFNFDTLLNEKVIRIKSNFFRFIQDWNFLQF